MASGAESSDTGEMAIAHVPCESGHVAASATAPWMQPVAFEQCFGWLHGDEACAGSDVCVVLCAGVGRDASTAHRSMRRLADQLAAAGYPTLRFDYRRTGDTCDDAATGCWTAWRGSLDAAVDWLRRRSGARRVVLVGLRIGASLACVAASERDDIASLVLLEPVLRGRSYVGQLSIEARLQQTVESPAAGALAIDELLLDAETLRLISQMDLRQLAFGANCAMSVFSRAHTAILSACVQAWRAGGASVTCASFTGLDALLRPSHLSADEPHADFSPLLRWLQAGIPQARSGRGHALTPPAPAALHPGGCVETPHRFGAGARLLGMLCRPAGQPSPDRLAVIICNTGGDPHHGFARFSVEFARTLARHGIASLRIDFAGLGDSANPDGAGGEDVTDIFTADRGVEIGAAVDLLQGLGFRRFALKGLCSGAYHAWRGGLADPLIDVLLLINLPFFSLRMDRPGPASFARAGFASLRQRQARSLLLHCAGDVGLKPLEQHFGPQGQALADPSAAAVSIVPGLDHDLTTSAMRRDAADRMIGFLRQAPSDECREERLAASHPSLQDRRAGAAEDASAAPICILAS